MIAKSIRKYLTFRYAIGAIIFAALSTILFLTYNSLNDRQTLLFQNKTLLMETSVQLNKIKKYMDGFHMNNDKESIGFKKNEILSELTNFQSNLDLLDTNKVIRKKTIKAFKTLADNVKTLLENEKNDLNKSSLAALFILDINKLQKELNNNIKEFDQELKANLLAFNRYNIIIWLGSLIAVHMIVIFILRPTIKNITDDTQKIIEERDEAQLATQKKSDYLSIMGHEIRTPLNSILGLNQLLLQTKINKEQKEYLQLIEDSGDNLLQILNDIFDFSKIDYGQLELDQMIFSVHSVIEDLIEHYLPKAAEKNLDLLYIIEPDVPEFVLGDSRRLKQCVFNLINNSIKFTRDGEIIVRVNVLHVVENKQEIQISVSDTGIGIPENKLKILFNPFVHSPAPVSRRFEGTGLGLAIAAKLVELMDGRIWVESEINKGTTVYMAVHFETQQNVKQLTAKKDLGVLSRKRVLVMDNNETNRKIITVQCHNWGMHPKSISSVEDIQKELNTSEHFDFAILNYDLIKAFNPELLNDIKDLPTILIYMDNLSEKQEFSKYHHLLKSPFKQALLYEYITNIAQQINAQKQLRKKTKKQAVIASDLKLLLAEDNLINQKLIERILSTIGYTIDIAQDGYQVIEMAKRKKYDIIFMDLQMPGVDGIEATRRILNADQNGSSPRIIAMTANVRKEDKEQCFEAGMVDYITKPINVEKVKQLLNYWGSVS